LDKVDTSVEVGQIWQDNRSYYTRHVIIEEIADRHAVCYCPQSRKVTKILLMSFSNLPSGFTLVTDEEKIASVLAASTDAKEKPSPTSSRRQREIAKLEKWNQAMKEWNEVATRESQ